MLSLIILSPFTSRATSGRSRVAFGSTGILQLTWLLGHEPRMNIVSTPQSTALRRAGMFDVQMSAIVEERLELAVGLQCGERASIRTKPYQQKKYNQPIVQRYHLPKDTFV